MKISELIKDLQALEDEGMVEVVVWDPETLGAISISHVAVDRHSKLAVIVDDASTVES